jgi:hypothetical protein
MQISNWTIAIDHVSTEPKARGAKIRVVIKRKNEIFFMGDLDLHQCCPVRFLVPLLRFKEGLGVVAVTLWLLWNFTNLNHPQPLLKRRRGEKEHRIWQTQSAVKNGILVFSKSPITSNQFLLPERVRVRGNKREIRIHQALIRAAG